jgi:hypothetical protein
MGFDATEVVGYQSPVISQNQNPAVVAMNIWRR